LPTSSIAANQTPSCHREPCNALYH